MTVTHGAGCRCCCCVVAVARSSSCDMSLCRLNGGRCRVNRDGSSYCHCDFNCEAVRYIQYGLCLLVHLTITGKAPLYVSTVLQPVSTLTGRSTFLRSATRSDLLAPRTRVKFGERAFSVAATKAWNDLPLHVRAIDSTLTRSSGDSKLISSANFMTAVV